MTKTQKEIKETIKDNIVSLKQKLSEQDEIIRSLRQGLKLAMADESQRTGKIKTAYDKFYK